MVIKSYIPTKIYFENNVVSNNADIFLECGNKAFITTGKSGAQKSGALNDIVKELEGISQKYIHFDEIEENPSIANVEQAAALCKQHSCDYIIAIGGGSALDAAKAIAILASNNISAMDLLTKSREQLENDCKSVLPIIAVPTTSGTGSEITPYSILTVDEWSTKKSFAADSIYPKYALLDAKYTHSLPENYTIATAFDAASHLFESYFSLKSTDFSQMYALEGLRVFQKTIKNIENNNYDKKCREQLMYASLMGGLAISHTGTTAMHALGYSMTYFHNMPHGLANLYFCKPYFFHLYKYEKEKVEKVLEILKFDDVQSLCDFFLNKFERPILTIDECESYASLAMLQGSIQATPGSLDAEKLKDMYKQAGGL